MVCKLVDLANRIKSGFAQTSSPVRVLTDLAFSLLLVTRGAANQECGPPMFLAMAQQFGVVLQRRDYVPGCVQ
jgi:hypothetical protein